ncbi:TPA: 6-carboxytetrahydropterin synthase, partial [Staphylococcus aureus]|nr:6-carboxytetrahydropterin synthase [Staphylococcus aureus]
LNNLPAFKNKIPSTEIVAETIYQIVKENLASLEHQPKCIQVFVRETPTSYVVFRPKEQV